MDYSTIGVISTPDGRSQRDMDLQNAFHCKRQPQNIPSVIGEGLGVLGTDIEERSVRDKQMVSDFSCSAREDYSEPQMIYPRSDRDMAMLQDFGANCSEKFTYQGQHWGQQAKLARMNSRESYCRGCPCGCRGGPNCPCNCRNCPYCRANVENYSNMPGFARLNYNPYNTSGNIKYIPLQ